MVAEATVTPPLLRLNLLRGFELRRGDRLVPMVAGAQRLAALVALQQRMVSRSFVAGTLWPEAPTFRANANLRSALWRVQGSCRQLIQASSQHLGLSPHVIVDVHAAASLANRMLNRFEPLRDEDLDTAMRLSLSSDLLPDWYDDWVLVEREHFRQLRLHALEALCQRLTNAKRYGEAVDAGLAAVQSEPLRESAHRVLIQAHLAEGNQWEAVRQYRLCRRLLLNELGVEPSPEITELLRSAGATYFAAITSPLPGGPPSPAGHAARPP
jgi:DNA-binding SARP family transcriptional activator